MVSTDYGECGQLPPFGLLITSNSDRVKQIVLSSKRLDPNFTGTDDCSAVHLDEGAERSNDSGVRWPLLGIPSAQSDSFKNAPGVPVRA